MKLSKINNYINPCSVGIKKAIEDFDHLSKWKKITTVALSVLAGVATLFVGGIAGFATFKALTDYFTTRIQPKTNSTVGKADHLAKEKLNSSKKEELKGPTLTTAQCSKFEVLLNKLANSNLEILGKISELLKNSDFKELTQSVSEMPYSSQKELLSKFKADHKKFLLIIAAVAYGSPFIILITCSNLENVEWPNEEIKKQYLIPLLITLIKDKAIFRKFIKINKNQNLSDNQENFPYYYMSLRMRNIVGSGEFIAEPKPFTPILAEAIGSAIQQLAIKAQTPNEQFKAAHFKAHVQVNIAQTSVCQFPASMIAPILPYLRNVPGLVSLNLAAARDGKAKISTPNKNGFSDQHAEDLLEILRTNSNLKKIRINLDGMSKEGLEAFDVQSKQIIFGKHTRPDQPSPKQLI